MVSNQSNNALEVHPFSESDVFQDECFTRPVHIIIPLYKAPELIPGLFSSLKNCSSEINKIAGKIVIINDSPGHEPLEAMIAEFSHMLDNITDVKIYSNEKNLGFLQTCNFAIARAHADNSDVILLNSDAIITGGALTEMRRVAATDPLISVVSPRSNNATICNSPYPDRFRHLSTAEAFAAHKAIQKYLPRITYAPVAVGFCLLIRYEMVEEFGAFDPIYGGGYNEENDFIIRCNQRGYRAVLANHAFVFHLGSVSFSSSDTGPAEREKKNRAIFIDRYPEYPRAVDRYFNSVGYRAEYIASGLIPQTNGRRRILFDGRTIGDYFSGTFELAFNMISQFVRMYQHEFDCFIAINHSALVFHHFDQIHGLSYCWGEEAHMAPFAAVIRLAQPFNLDDMRATVHFAPVVNYLMLDTIALDCQQLDDPDLKTIWNIMSNVATSIGYISDFSKDQFQRRFAIPDYVTQYVALCSTDIAEYAPSVSEGGGEGHLLVVGNHFPHKNIDGLIERLLAIKPMQKIVILGAKTADVDGVVSYKAGELAQDFVDKLYDDASMVLFPSFYEGFGLPIMHALARQKPVICRDIPVAREIKAKTRFGRNIILCSSTKEIALRSQTGVRWNAEMQVAQEETWASATTALYRSLKADMEKFDLNICAKRLAHIERTTPNVAANDQSQTALAPSKLTQRITNLAQRGDGEARVLIEMPVTGTNEQIICQIILDEAAKLRLNGQMALRLRYDATRFDPLHINHQFTMWLLNFGFDAINTRLKDQLIEFDAVLQERWDDQGIVTDDNQTFVEWAYTHILQRPIDASGINYWVEQLNLGFARKAFLASLYCSAERQNLISSAFERSLS